MAVTRTAQIAKRLESRGSTTVTLKDGSRAEYDRAKALLRAAGKSLGEPVRTTKIGNKVRGILV